MKVDVIRSNQHKYPISAIYYVLGVSRSISDYELTEKMLIFKLYSGSIYVRVNEQWDYIRLFIDLFNRKNYWPKNAGAHKTVKLVYESLVSINRNPRSVRLFHTGRENDFEKG